MSDRETLYYVCISTHAVRAISVESNNWPRHTEAYIWAKERHMFALRIEGKHLEEEGGEGVKELHQGNQQTSSEIANAK